MGKKDSFSVLKTSTWGKNHLFIFFTVSKTTMDENDSVDTYEENPEYDTIKTQCDALITTDSIQKEEALNILKMFHSSEKKYMEMMFAKQKEIDNLRNELTIVRLTNKNAELLQQLSQDTLRTDKSVQELLSDVTTLNGQMAHVITKIKK